MVRIILVVAVLTVALLLWYKIKSASGEQRKKLIIKTLIGGLLALLAVLAITGKLNVIVAALGALAAFIPRLLSYARYWPLISRLFAQNRTRTTQQQNGARQDQSRQARAAKTMSREEALAILGLKENASKEDILAAHKRMMQKLHPDRGGSDHLAAQINKAKETLLG